MTEEPESAAEVGQLREREAFGEGAAIEQGLEGDHLERVGEWGGLELVEEGSE